jgi:hypothetical protein
LPCTYFADAVCECGGRVFDLQTDDEYQEAELKCPACGRTYLFHTAGPDGPYPGDPKSDTRWRACPCDGDPNNRLEVALGGCLAEGSEVPRQVSIGCRCVKCGLVGSYADWTGAGVPWPRLVARLRNRVWPEDDKAEPGAGRGGGP